MCHVVLERLKYSGVFFKSPSMCTNATIDSEYGTTLRELYEQYEKLDNKQLKIHFVNLHMHASECKQTCQYLLLFDGSIQKWVDKNTPELIADKCYPYPYPLSEKMTCLPFVNITVGGFELNHRAYDPCLQCLDKYDQKVDEYNKFRRDFIQFPAILSREVAVVWRLQMPTQLAIVANSALLKY